MNRCCKCVEVCCIGVAESLSAYSDAAYLRYKIDHFIAIQPNLIIMNPGYNELPGITNTDLRMYTYLLYVNEP